MKKSHSFFVLIIFSLFVLSTIWLLPTFWSSQQGDTPILSSESSVILPKMNKAVDYRATTNEGRQEYLFNLLKDPVSQEIPRGIRSRELNFGQELAKELAPKAKMRNWTL